MKRIIFAVCGLLTIGLAGLLTQLQVRAYELTWADIEAVQEFVDSRVDRDRVEFAAASNVFVRVARTTNTIAGSLSNQNVSEKTRMLHAWATQMLSYMEWRMRRQFWPLAEAFFNRQQGTTIRSEITQYLESMDVYESDWMGWLDWDNFEFLTAWSQSTGQCATTISTSPHVVTWELTDSTLLAYIPSAYVRSLSQEWYVWVFSNITNWRNVDWITDYYIWEDPDTGEGFIWVWYHPRNTSQPQKEFKYSAPFDLPENCIEDGYDIESEIWTYTKWVRIETFNEGQYILFQTFGHMPWTYPKWYNQILFNTADNTFTQLSSMLTMSNRYNSWTHLRVINADDESLTLQEMPRYDKEEDAFVKKSSWYRTYIVDTTTYELIDVVPNAWIQYDNASEQLKSQGYIYYLRRRQATQNIIDEIFERG